MEREGTVRERVRKSERERESERVMEREGAGFSGCGIQVKLKHLDRPVGPVAQTGLTGLV